MSVTDEEFCTRIEAVFTKQKFLRPLRELCVQKVVNNISFYMKSGIKTFHRILRK
jgi:hypothetical protein